MPRTARSPLRTAGLPGRRARAIAAAATVLLLVAGTAVPSAGAVAAPPPESPQTSPTPQASPSPTPTPTATPERSIPDILRELPPEERRQWVADHDEEVDRWIDQHPDEYLDYLEEFSHDAGISDAPDVAAGLATNPDAAADAARSQFGGAIPTAAELVGDVLGALRDTIVEPLSDWISRPFINWLIDVPDFAASSPELKGLLDYTSAMSLGLIAAMLTLSALSYWASGLSLASGDSSAGPLEAIQRAVGAGLFIAAWPWVYDVAMRLGNGATDALIGQSRIDAATAALGANLFAADAIALGPIGLILGLVVAITFLLVVVGITLMKIGMSVALAVLFIGMPLSAALWVVPALSWIAQLCLRAFTAIVTVPVVWALAIAALCAITNDFHVVNVLGDDANATNPAQGQSSPAITDIFSGMLVGIVGWLMLIKLGQIILQRGYGGGGASAGSMLLHGAIYGLVHGSFAGAAGGAGAATATATPGPPTPPFAPPPPPSPPTPPTPPALPAAAPLPATAPSAPVPGPGPTYAGGMPIHGIGTGSAGALPPVPPDGLAPGSAGALPAGPPPAPGSASPSSSGDTGSASTPPAGAADGPTGQPPPPGHNGGAASGANGAGAHEGSPNPFAGRQQISVDQATQALGSLERSESAWFEPATDNGGGGGFSGGQPLDEYLSWTDQANHSSRIDALNAAAHEASDDSTRYALQTLAAADAQTLETAGAGYRVEFVEEPRTEPPR